MADANKTKTGLDPALPASTGKPALVDAYQRLHRDYERFRQEVTDLIMSHESCDGCLTGRQDAARELGLVVPSLKKRVTIEFTVDPDYFDPTEAADAVVDHMDHRIYNDTGFRDVTLISAEDID